MPDFQNPTGRSMSAETRERVLDAAARQGTVVIADETIAELDIDRPRHRSCRSPPYGPAVMVGSVGKTVWGGLRVGWIRADRPLIRRLLAVRSPATSARRSSSSCIVTRLLERIDEILELRREQLRAGRDRLEALLADAFPEWHVPHVDGGIITWVSLGAPVSSQLALAARARGTHHRGRPALRHRRRVRALPALADLLPGRDDRAAVQALSRAWRSLSRTPAPDQSLLASVV